MEQLLTVKEAADILNISRATIYLIMAESKLPYVKVRGGRRIRKEDLEMYIQKNTSKPVKTDDVKGMKRFKYKPGMNIV